MKGTERYFALWVIGLILAACGFLLSILTAVIKPFNEVIMCFAIAFDGIGFGICVCTALLGRYVSDKEVEEDEK